MAQSWRLHVLHRLILGNIETIFLSETTRSRALIFDMKHHLVRFYQFYSSWVFGTKVGPALRGHMFNIRIYWENLNKTSCLTPQGVEH